MKKRIIKQMAGFTIILFCALLSACASGKTGSQTDSEKNTGTSQVTGTAESGKLTAEEGAVVKFLYWEGSPSDAAAWELIFDKFKKDHPEITLQAEAYPSNTYVSQLDTMIAGDNWPDVMRYTYQRLGKFKEADVMLDLTDMINTESTDDLLPAYKQAVTSNGRLVGMPHHTDTIGLFYNKEMFKKSNIRIPQNAADGWTWDELKEYAKKLKEDNNLEYAFGGIWEKNSGYRYLPFVYMNGGAVLSDDGTQITIDSPKASEAFKLYEDLRKDDLIINTGFTQDAQNNMMFVAKKLAFVFAGSWHLSYMQENMPDNWGVTYMPQVGGKTTSDMGGNGLFAYKGTKYPKASAIFIDYITNKENMKAFCEEGNFLPVRKSLISEGLNYKSFTDEMKTFTSIVATVDEKMAADETSTRFQQLNAILNEQMDYLAIDKSATAEKAVKAMKEEMQAAIDE
ncbi:ABC transporter substrate-binding protein [Anaerocolumna xylanovorans]|uniref:ABC-type glycerol-3-phosphate transport system, substrate-binding protein n=1 Tax=Anaerocolumna xylanovorans DSM 12503 TaxID=1121345 RepID=A0A1M7YNJ2_9FIRM|nr:sugar ABC transporter substrate-binding protein [Anaerocolumna xylanovorans]SHO54233.1 ABC-type glycerol-3-phosphate transport system, substrate-binding protein [Anaerocolumna xylanovorans DSM 12503]